MGGLETAMMMAMITFRSHVSFDIALAEEPG